MPSSTSTQLPGIQPPPTKLRAQFDSGDHIHPNDAGNHAMAEAIDLKLFR